MKKKTSPIATSIKCWCRHCGTVAEFLIPLVLALAGFALSPQARATCQDGCNINTAATFLGDDALVNNISGTSNTAIGSFALSSNTGGSENTAVGNAALFLNSGTRNTAIGSLALRFNTTGNFNTATGVNALLENTTGSNNIALGDNAGENLTTGSDNIDIANVGVAGESGRIRIGNRAHTATFIAGISGVAVTGSQVIVNSNGKLGVTASSARYKEAIKPMDNASEAILALKPVSFRYKKELDADGIPQFGLVAEEVEKVNPDLVVRDEQGKPYSVRYESVNAMLLNEFLKEHKKTEKLEATVTSLIATVKEQAAQIQKVSAQVELNKPAPQMVNSN